MRFRVTLHRVQNISRKSLEKLFPHGSDMVAANTKHRITRLQTSNHLLRRRINGKVGMRAYGSIHGNVDIRLNSVDRILTQ
tara:strand:+ start:420 stop:662 length:243 start_codon:yes stop_codon:yes gene_type:complete